MSVEELQRIISPKFTEKTLHEIIQCKRKLENVRITKIVVGSAAKKGDSYLSTVTKFTVDAVGTNDKGEEESLFIPVIIKSLPANIGRRKTYRSVDFFENEIIFYKEVWPAMRQFQISRNVHDESDIIPLFFTSHMDENDGYVALEDLSYRGFGSALRGDDLNYEHSLMILRIFARFHGLALAFKNQEPQKFEKAALSLRVGPNSTVSPISETYTETYFAEQYRQWYGNFQERIFSIFKDAITKELPPTYLQHLKQLISDDLYGKLCKVCATRGPLAVITHGDAWVPNFLFKYSNGDDEMHPVDVTMIDFQLTRYSNLTTDLTFFLLTCVGVPLLEKHWDDFVVEYHKTLTDTLEKYGSERTLVPLQDLFDEISSGVFLGVGMSMEALVMQLLDEDQVSDLDAIQGDKAVPLESVWIVKPFESREKRQRLAAFVKFAVDKGFI